MSRSKPNSTSGNSAKLTWAVGADGELTNICEAKNGLKCACTCPACGRALIARQGKIREHHFTHASREECPYAVETALHLVAKDILTVRKELVLPAIKIPSRYVRPNSKGYLAPQRRYSIESVKIEQRLGSIIPDVIVKISGRELIVEVTVTHGVDRDKLSKIRELGLSCLEIDLSKINRGITREELEKIVVDGIAHKRWLYVDRIEERVRKKLSEKTLLFLQQGIPLHVDGCPISTKTDKNEVPYAYVNHDCVKCDHGLVTSLKVGVICDGFRALGKPQPPRAHGIHVPPEAFEHPEEKDPMRAVDHWLDKQIRVSRSR